MQNLVISCCSADGWQRHVQRFLTRVHSYLYCFAHYIFLLGAILIAPDAVVCLSSLMSCVVKQFEQHFRFMCKIFSYNLYN